MSVTCWSRRTVKKKPFDNSDWAVISSSGCWVVNQLHLPTWSCSQSMSQSCVSVWSCQRHIWALKVACYVWWLQILFYKVANVIFLLANQSVRNIKCFFRCYFSISSFLAFLMRQKLLWTSYKRTLLIRRKKKTFDWNTRVCLKHTHVFGWVAQARRPTW